MRTSANNNAHSARIVVMGVSGSGKTTVGQALARALNATFIDGDALHSTENIATMAGGIPLTDDDRWPWLDAVGKSLHDTDPPVIIGCSALKRYYRDRIRAKAHHPILFVYLRGSRDLIKRRMASRVGHFMPEALLDSQFAALEPPANDEDAITVEIDGLPTAIVESVMAHLLG